MRHSPPASSYRTGIFGTELLNNQLWLYSQHGLHRAGHPQVGDVSGPLGKNGLVGGGYMGMGAEHGRYPPIQKISQRPLFSSGFRVKIYQNNGWQVFISLAAHP